MVAITDNTKSKSERTSLKEEPINGGMKRWETLMSSIFVKSTCSSKKSMFLCREAHKSSFDVNQESCVWRCADLRSGMWWELQRDYPPLTQRRKKLQLSKRDLVSWFIKNSKHAWFAGYNKHQSYKCIYTHMHENQHVIRQPGEHGRGGFCASSFSPTAKIAPLQPLQSHNSVKNNCLICNRLMHLMVKVF